MTAQQNQANKSLANPQTLNMLDFSNQIIVDLNNFNSQNMAST